MELSGFTTSNKVKNHWSRINADRSQCHRRHHITSMSVLKVAFKYWVTATKFDHFNLQGRKQTQSTCLPLAPIHIVPRSIQRVDRNGCMDIFYWLYWLFKRMLTTVNLQIKFFCNNFFRFFPKFLSGALILKNEYMDFIYFSRCWWWNTSGTGLSWQEVLEVVCSARPTVIVPAAHTEEFETPLGEEPLQNPGGGIFWASLGKKVDNNLSAYCNSSSLRENYTTATAQTSEI